MFGEGHFLLEQHNDISDLYLIFVKIAVLLPSKSRHKIYLMLIDSLYGTTRKTYTRSRPKSLY